MTIPFWFLLIPYGIFLLIFFVMSGFAVYHSNRFGFKSKSSNKILAAFAAGATVILIITIIGIASLDWSSDWDFLVNLNSESL